MLGQVNVENKINFTFYNYVNSWRRVLNTGKTKFGVRELIYKVVTPDDDDDDDDDQLMMINCFCGIVDR